MFKRFLKIIVLAYIYQLAKFGDLMSCGSKNVFKNASCLMYLYSLWRHRLGKSLDGYKYQILIIFKTGIAFLWNKTILSQCLFLRSHCFVTQGALNILPLIVGGGGGGANPPISFWFFLNNSETVKAVARAICSIQ